jgi:hypothetical protein
MHPRDEASLDWRAGDAVAPDLRSVSPDDEERLVHAILTAARAAPEEIP